MTSFPSYDDVIAKARHLKKSNDEWERYRQRQFEHDINKARERLRPEALFDALDNENPAGDHGYDIYLMRPDVKYRQRALRALEEIPLPESISCVLMPTGDIVARILTAEYTWKLRIIHGDNVIKERIVELDRDEKPMPLKHSVPITVVGCSISDCQFVKDHGLALRYLEKELELVRTTRDSEHWKVSEEILEWVINGLKSDDTYHFTCTAT